MIRMMTDEPIDTVTNQEKQIVTVALSQISPENALAIYCMRPGF